jgi:hypothetical protein
LQGGGYLVLQDWTLRPSPSYTGSANDHPTRSWAAAQERALELELSGGDGDHEQLDVAMLPVQQPAATQRTETHVYEYHVLHSASYGVPVLYFRGNHYGALSALDALAAPFPPRPFRGDDDGHPTPMDATTRRCHMRTGKARGKPLNAPLAPTLCLIVRSLSIMRPTCLVCKHVNALEGLRLSSAYLQLLHTSFSLSCLRTVTPFVGRPSEHPGGYVRPG